MYMCPPHKPLYTCQVHSAENDRDAENEESSDDEVCCLEADPYGSADVPEFTAACLRHYVADRSSETV